MLMIFSDFFKASWQLIYPAVVFSNGGNITSESRFCQTAGFMMSMGIEASGM
jgi:G protein-coupled receptor GPR1